MRLKNYIFLIIIFCISLSLIITSFSSFSNKDNSSDDKINIHGEFVNLSEINDFMNFLRKNNLYYNEYKEFSTKGLYILKKNINFYIFLKKKCENLVTKDELLMHIHSMNIFYDNNKFFSYSFYKDFLDRHRINEYLFQENLKVFLKNNKFVDTFLYIFNKGVCEKKIKKIFLILNFETFNMYSFYINAFNFYYDIKNKYIRSIKSVEYYDLSIKNFILNINIYFNFFKDFSFKKKEDTFLKVICYSCHKISDIKKRIYFFYNYDSNLFKLHKTNLSFLCIREKKYIVLNNLYIYKNCFYHSYKKKALNFRFKIKSLFFNNINFEKLFLTKVYFVKPYSYNFFVNIKPYNIKKFDYFFFRNVDIIYNKKFTFKVNKYFYTNLTNLFYLKSFLSFNNFKNLYYKIDYKFAYMFDCVFLLTDESKKFSFTTFNYNVYFLKNKNFLGKFNFFDQYFSFKNFFYSDY